MIKKLKNSVIKHGRKINPNTPYPRRAKAQPTKVIF